MLQVRFVELYGLIINLTSQKPDSYKDRSDIKENMPEVRSQNLLLALLWLTL